MRELGPWGRLIRGDHIAFDMYSLDKYTLVPSGRLGKSTRHLGWHWQRRSVIWSSKECPLLNTQLPLLYIGEILTCHKFLWDQRNVEYEDDHPKTMRESPVCPVWGPDV